MAKLTDLNDDVVHEILSHIPPESTQSCLCSLASTSRFFYYEATRRIFTKITIGKTDGSGAERLHLLRRGLLESPNANRRMRLRALVRKIDVLAFDADEEFLQSLDNVLGVCRNLQRIRIAGAAKGTPTWTPEFPRRNPLPRLSHVICTIRHVCWSSATVVKLVSLENIEYICLIDIQHDTQTALAWSRCMTTPRTEPLQVLDLGPVNDIPYEALDGILALSRGTRKLKARIPGYAGSDHRDFRSRSHHLACPARIAKSLRPAQTTLEYLNLIGCDRTWNQDGSCLDLHGFLRLRVLKIPAILFFPAKMSVGQKKRHIHHLLPRSSEEIEIYFDIWQSPPFEYQLSDFEWAPDVDWLLGIPHSKSRGDLAQFQRLFIEGRSRHVQTLEALLPAFTTQDIKLEVQVPPMRPYRSSIQAALYQPESGRFETLFR